MLIFSFVHQNKSFYGLDYRFAEVLFLFFKLYKMYYF